MTLVRRDTNAVWISVCREMTGGQNFRKWGNPEVHLSAYPVEVFDNVLRAQVARLCRRLDEADGAGLVATQVGLPQRVFAFRLSPVDEIDVLVTPRIAAPSDELATFVEGCLSFNAVAVEVQRPAGVGVVARDVHGRRRGLESDGFAASLVQRQIDHLDGILSLD